MPIYRTPHGIEFLYSTDEELTGPRGGKIPFSTLLGFSVSITKYSAKAATCEAFDQMIDHVRALGGNAAICVTTQINQPPYGNVNVTVTITGTAVKAHLRPSHR